MTGRASVSQDTRVPPPPDLRQTLEAALEGQRQAIGELVATLTPVIQARAARALARSGRGRGRDARQELSDLVQEVLLLLFRHDAQVLRGWKPTGGLSLVNFVGLVAEREVGHIARSGRRSPWALDPTEETALERAAPAVASAEAGVGARDLFERVHERLQVELSDQALQLFRLLVIEELPAAEVGTITGLSADAIYTWRHRLLRRARQLLTELSSVPESGRADPIPSTKEPRPAP